jgi:hypothetical protein
VTSELEQPPKILFQDDFANAPNGRIDPNLWNFNVYSGGGSFYGRTQQRQELPIAQGGVMRLRLNTFNPTDSKHTTLLGSEAISRITFGPPSGKMNILFAAQLRYEQPQRGIIGGFFTFAGPAATHDEIDFEAMSNTFTQIQTNIYHNEPLGDGHFKYHPLSDSLSTFHTFSFNWNVKGVEWQVDGVTVRTETILVPTKPMALHFNIWAGPASWPTGSDSLIAATQPQDDKTFFFDVQKVLVMQHFAP